MNEHFNSFDYEEKALSSLTAAVKETTDLICKTFARLDEFEREAYLSAIQRYVAPVDAFYDVERVRKILGFPLDDVPIYAEKSSGLDVNT